MPFCKVMSTPMNWDALTSISTAISAIIVLFTGILLYSQLKEMKKGTAATAFSSIVAILQDEKVRKARHTLMNISEKDFTKWTDQQKKDAELACSKYDVVGIMLHHNVIDHEMVTNEWDFSIKSCWEHAEPMIRSYRETRGERFWDDFEWLYELVKKRGNKKPIWLARFSKTHSHIKN
jgi:hypothetical protein